MPDLPTYLKNTPDICMLFVMDEIFALDVGGGLLHVLL